jgi:hypothetical protein
VWGCFGVRLLLFAICFGSRLVFWVKIGFADYGLHWFTVGSVTIWFARLL